MKKYYKIPMTERIVFINNKPLLKILQENYPELAKREKGRVELTYGENGFNVSKQHLESKIKNYNDKTAKMYHQRGVPTHMIGIQTEEGKIIEYITGVPIETSYDLTSFLTSREITQEEACQFLTEESCCYLNNISNMLLKTEEPKTFIKKVKEVLLRK